MNNNEIILYQPDGSISLEVLVENETIWLTQTQIGALFGVQKAAVSKHLKNIFAHASVFPGKVFQEIRRRFYL